MSAGGPVPSLKVSGLTKEYGTVMAVAGVDLEVAPGEFFGLLGPNGAGKSTMIRMITGLLQPTAGRIEILGIDIQSDPVGAKRLFGLLPQENHLFERLSGLEYVEFAGRMYGLAEDDVHSRSRELLDLLQLEDRDRLIIDYSTGMRKKVGLAAALIHAPRMLFLDEPFNGVDVVTTRIVRDLLASLARKGVTVLFSSHILEMVEKLCTRVAILRKGKLAALGTVAELRAQTGLDRDLEGLFLHYTGSDEGGGGRELAWLS